MVKGGWASTGSIFTDSVAICVPRMRLRGEGELLGSALQRSNTAARNPYRAAEKRAVGAYIPPHKHLVGIDTGIVKPIVAAIPTVELCAKSACGAVRG
jgi:hypothetical protein